MMAYEFVLAYKEGMHPVTINLEYIRYFRPNRTQPHQRTDVYLGDAPITIALSYDEFAKIYASFVGEYRNKKGEV